MISLREWTNKEDLVRIRTKFVYIEGKKTPCYIKRIKINENEFVYSPNLGVPFYKWDKNMAREHAEWLKQYNKYQECSGYIVLLYNTPYIMIDTDSIEGEKLISEIQEFKNLPISKSTTKEYGRHRYIKLNDSGNYKKALKINGVDIDIITEYCFETNNISLPQEEQPTMDIQDFCNLINYQLEPKDLVAEERIIKSNGIKKGNVNSFKVKDKKRNDFCSKDEVIDEKTLFQIIDNLPVSKFENYDMWFKLLAGVHNQVCSKEQNETYKYKFMEFMRTSKNWTAKWDRENLDTWNSITDNGSKFKVGSGSLWRWLREYNQEKFINLKNKRRGQIDPPSFNEIGDYTIQKKMFEEDCFIVNSEKLTFYEMDNITNELKERNEGNFMAVWKTLKTKIEKTDKKGNTTIMREKFIDMWINDAERRTYDRINFDPPPIDSHWKTYNLYDGLYIDDVDDTNYLKLSHQEKMDMIEPILEHLYYLSGCEKNCYDFMIKIFAYKLQYPARLHNISVVLKSVQGCGKNAFLDWFGQKILGDKYYACSANTEDFCGQFNTMNLNKLLIVFNEMGGEAGYKYASRLKSLATDEQQIHEKKGIDRKKIRNCSLCVYASNSNNPVKVEIGDRRFFVVECSDRVLYIPNYFENLFEKLDCCLTAMCFKYYLTEVIEIEDGYNFKINRPITQAYRYLQNKNKPVFVRFCAWFVDKTFKSSNDGCCWDDNYSSRELWTMFQLFMSETKWSKYDYEAFVGELSKFVYPRKHLFKPQEINLCVMKYKSSTFYHRFNKQRTMDLVNHYEVDAKLYDDSDYEDEAEIEQEFIDSDFDD